MSDHKAELSARLQAIASFVKKGETITDIGTDHGFLPIRLVQDGICPGAVAADVREGPLNRAREHIFEAGLTDRIGTRLSDGFQKIRAGETDAAVIAGMGGPLTIRILREGEKTARSMKHLVLSPQSEIDEVRRYLDGADYEIRREQMLTDMGKFYVVMDVVPGKVSPPFDETEYLFGRDLIQRADPVLREYLSREETLCRTILETLTAGGTDRAKSRMEEIHRYLHEIETARGRMEEKT